MRLKVVPIKHFASDEASVTLFLWDIAPGKLY